jgi:hypothetical protein
MLPPPDPRQQDPTANQVSEESHTLLPHSESDSARGSNTAPPCILASPPLDPGDKPIAPQSQQPKSRRARWGICKAGKGRTAVRQLPQLWTPIWLRKASLIAFATLNIVFLLVLLVLWYVSRKENGLPVSPSTNHYVWIYGPTAVLVIAVGFWQQVDYHCKALLPWKEMQKGYISATQTLLLDYLSPLELIAFWKALHQRHVVILVTIAGLWVLKLIVRMPVVYLILTNLDPRRSSQLACWCSAKRQWSIKHFLTESQLNSTPQVLNLLPCSVLPRLA